MRVMNSGRYKLYCDGRPVGGVVRINMSSERMAGTVSIDLYAGAVKLSTEDQHVEEAPSADQ